MNPNGTGIGLSICKKIVDELKGKIWCESQRGEGSTFGFELPAEKGPKEERGVVIQPTTRTNNTENILSSIIDEIANEGERRDNV